jgi:hypothetical protein
MLRSLKVAVPVIEFCVVVPPRVATLVGSVEMLAVTAFVAVFV